MSNNVVLLKYNILQDVTHCFTTRTGGVSTGGQTSLNLSFSREKSADNVRENYKRAAEALGVDYNKLTRVPQKHTDRVLKVTKELIGIGVSKNFTEEILSCGYDAMITNIPGITLCTIHADCVPVFLVDPVKHAIGLAHSGWRGTVARIAAKTVQCMQNSYGSNPADIVAVTGPCICCNCYEVGDEVADAFRSEFGEEVFARIATQRNEKAHINLSEAIAQSLFQIGVRKVTQSNSCTACNSELLFSHRVTQGKRGTLASFLAIKG